MSFLSASNWADNEYFDPVFVDELPCVVCGEMECVCDARLADMDLGEDFE